MSTMELNFMTSGLSISFMDHFNDYKTFMDATRDPIYRIILNAFEELKKEESVAINVTAFVENTEFESELGFTKLNLDILTDVINPYFEEIEEYETCAVVMSLLSELQKVLVSQ